MCWCQNLSIQRVLANENKRRRRQTKSERWTNNTQMLHQTWTRQQRSYLLTYHLHHHHTQLSLLLTLKYTSTVTKTNHRDITIMAAFFFNSLRSLWAIYENAQIDLINLRKRTLQITLLFGHAHTTHNAVKYINVCVNIDDVAVAVPWVWWM